MVVIEFQIRLQLPCRFELIIRLIEVYIDKNYRNYLRCCSTIYSCLCLIEPIVYQTIITDRGQTVLIINRFYLGSFQVLIPF